ncbi:MAG TPA: hypothetical protein VH109_04645 [Steroidobacteraceae bacterium]|nr:hypothetical protein [Steroidobacteraceae bacterium]
MPTPRTAPALLCVLLAAVLGGCASGGSAEAPAGLNLSGNWKLDHAASDDPQKTLASMREQIQKLTQRAREANEARTGVGTADPDAPDARGAARRDPLRRSPMAQVVLSVLHRGDFLSIRQTATQFVLDYGGVERSYTPGENSVVSAQGGVGDQNAGWKGREFVIITKGQMGTVVTESYGLSADGKRLIMKLHVAPAELAAVTLNRVYDPTTEAAPRQLPSTD